MQCAYTLWKRLGVKVPIKLQRKTESGLNPLFSKRFLLTVLYVVDVVVLTGDCLLFLKKLPFLRLCMWVILPFWHVHLVTRVSSVREYGLLAHLKVKSGQVCQSRTHEMCLEVCLYLGCGLVMQAANFDF